MNGSAEEIQEGHQGQECTAIMSSIWRQIGVIQLLSYKHNHINSTLWTEIMFIDTIVLILLLKYVISIAPLLLDSL